MTPIERFQKECIAFFKEIYVGEDRVLVFGEGDPRARLMLIGEAPGEQEALMRRPFVGKAGKNLDEFLSLAQLERRQLFITNAVKFRPTKQSAAGRVVNRPPTREEIGLWQPWLAKEIALIQPALIATMGNVPLRAVTGKALSIGAVHGAVLAHEGLKLFPLYHPASLIYRPALREVYQDDIKALAQVLRQDDI